MKHGKYGSKGCVTTSKMERGQKFIQSTGQDQQAMSKSASAYTGGEVKGGKTNLSHSIKGASST